MDIVFLKIWQSSPHPFNCKNVEHVQLSSNFLLLLSLIASYHTHVPDLKTLFKKCTSEVGILQRRKARLWKAFSIS